MRLVVVALIFLCAVGVLVGVNLKESTIPVVELAALTGADSQYRGETVIVDGSKIVAIESLYPLRFEIAPDGDALEPLAVVSQVSPPQNFKVGNPVRVWGTYDRQKRAFDAYMVTTQCPSRYKATEELKKSEERKARAGSPGGSLGDASGAPAGGP